MTHRHRRRSRGGGVELCACGAQRAYLITDKLKLEPVGEWAMVEALPPKAPTGLRLISRPAKGYR